jgi:hypothetical protein
VRWCQIKRRVPCPRLCVGMSAKLRQNVVTANHSATITSLPRHERTSESVSTIQRTGTCPFVDVLVLFPAAVSVQRSQPNVARGTDRPGQSCRAGSACRCWIVSADRCKMSDMESTSYRTASSFPAHVSGPPRPQGGAGAEGQEVTTCHRRATHRPSPTWTDFGASPSRSPCWTRSSAPSGSTDTTRSTRTGPPGRRWRRCATAAATATSSCSRGRVRL